MNWYEKVMEKRPMSVMDVLGIIFGVLGAMEIVILLAFHYAR